MTFHEIFVEMFNDVFSEVFSVRKFPEIYFNLSGNFRKLVKDFFSIPMPLTKPQ